MSNPYQDALDAQDACNLSGVVHAFARACSWLIEHENTDTLALRAHPVSILFANKIVSLTDRGSELKVHEDSYHESYLICQAKSKENA